MNDNIFRAYDIRGIYETDISLDLAYDIGRAFGTILYNGGKNTTIVGYDNRISSVDLYNALTNGIISTGIDVINIGLVTTPMYYFAWYLFKVTSGIMITASHNPKEYNGFKISFNGKYNAYGDDILKFKNIIKKAEFVKGSGTIRNEDIKARYVDFIFESIRFGDKKLTVAVDAGNGSAAVIINDVIKRANHNFFKLYTTSEPDFPNHHPDPSVVENMADLRNMVITNKCDVGFAYDGDADRIGMVDELGNIVSPDEIMIIIIRDILPKLRDKRILYDVKCSKSLEDEIKVLGGIPVLSRTGNSYLRAAIYNERILFGGELSGHLFFNDKFEGYDDGIYASLRIMEILSHTDKTISQLLEGISKYYSTPEIKIAVLETNKFAIVEKIKAYATTMNYSFIDIDGCKIIWDDAFALVRASNTGPDLTVRFEAKTEERLQAINEEFITLINKIKSLS